MLFDHKLAVIHDCSLDQEMKHSDDREVIKYSLALLLLIHHFVNVPSSIAFKLWSIIAFVILFKVRDKHFFSLNLPCKLVNSLIYLLVNILLHINKYNIF